MANASRLFALGLFGVAGLLGLYAFTLTRGTPAPQNAHAPMAAPAAPRVAVIVAARDLTPGHALVADDLAVAMQDALPAGGFASASVLIGRLPAARIPAGGALTEGLLGTGISAAIEPGERAIAIRVDESNAVSNLVKPGDAVDVFVVLKRDSADGEVPASHARLLLSKVRVLGFGDNVIANADASSAPKAPGQSGAARTAVLGVRVEDVDALTLAENSGRLMLALRNPSDGDSTQVSVATIAKNQSPVARAAAGVSLATLTGGASVNNSSTRNGPLPPSMLAGTPMLPPMPANTGSTRRVASSGVGGIEVIRGSHSESVSNN